MRAAEEPFPPRLAVVRFDDPGEPPDFGPLSAKPFLSPHQAGEAGAGVESGHRFSSGSSRVMDTPYTTVASPSRNRTRRSHCGVLSALTLIALLLGGWAGRTRQ